MISQITIKSGEKTIVLDGTFECGQQGVVPYISGYANYAGRIQDLIDVTDAIITTDTGRTLLGAWQAGTIVVAKQLRVRFEGMQFSQRHTL